MIEDFFKTIVVPCAGEGSRLGIGGGAKCLALVNGRPIIYHIISKWKRLCENWIFIVRKGDAEIMKFLSAQDIHWRLVTQPEPLGIGDAVLRAEPVVENMFAVVLGDCLTAGTWAPPEAPFSTGIGIAGNASKEDICSNYGAFINENRVVKVVEKPSEAEGMFCGMGVYFLNSSIFEAIRGTAPDHDGKTPITSALQTLIDSGTDLAPVFFAGEYININNESDLARAESVFR